MKNKELLGAHMSIAKGFDQALRDGESIGCSAIQIFTHSNRQWHIKPLEQATINRFQEALKQSTIKAVVVHASYLINVGASNPETRAKSLTALTAELQRCEQLGIPHLVLHPGSAGEGSEEECMVRIAQGLDSAIEANPGKSMILLENSAGQGSAVGYTFEQLAHLRALSHHKKRIGFCFDTCHAFVAGYDISNLKSYTETWTQFDSLIGLEHLRALHINDSKKGLGSRVDRHEDIGKGVIPLEGFSLLMNDSRFVNVPKILETPNDTLEGFKKNLDVLRELKK